MVDDEPLRKTLRLPTTTVHNLTHVANKTKFLLLVLVVVVVHWHIIVYTPGVIVALLLCAVPEIAPGRRD
jgi:hypothetical protein